MLPISDFFPQVLPFLCLAISIITAFIKPKLSLYLLAATLVVGFVFNAIDVVGLVIVIPLFILSFYTQKLSNFTGEGDTHSNTTAKSYVSYGMTGLVIIACLALAVHLLPGFNNLQVLSDVSTNELSVPFNLFLNFDKPLIIFMLLLLIPSLLKPNKPISLFNIESTSTLILLTFLAFVFIFYLATTLSLISYVPNVPNWWWLFALNNLLLTCIAEEVFFRGVLQHKLVKLTNPILGLVITSSLFGLAHFSGGIGYIFVAILAGFIYGLVYLKTGKLWMAILTHFCLNMIHLFLFTYPLAKH